MKKPRAGTPKKAKAVRAKALRVVKPAKRAKTKAAQPSVRRKTAPSARKAARQAPATPAPPARTARPARRDGPANPVSEIETRDAGCYVYCIIRTGAPLRFGSIGIGAEPSLVHTVGYKDLAAVISDTPLDIQDPTRENVLAHERVNETVMQEHTVLPMSFGTVFRTPQDIVELLRTAYDAFNDVLIKMENKVEFGLKILWEPERSCAGSKSRTTTWASERGDLPQRGSTYFARMQYGRLVDLLLQERSRAGGGSVRAAPRVAIASRTNKPIGDKMILNAAFLVARDREAEFDARVKARRPPRAREHPLHRALAAVQLRQHPAQARARLGGLMFLLDSLLTGGLNFVLKQVQRAADEAGEDADSLRQDLLAAQMRFELGELSEEEFAEIETAKLAALRKLRPQAGPALDASTLGEVEVNFGGDEEQ